MSPKLVNIIRSHIITILETLALPATFFIGIYMKYFTRVPPIYLIRSYKWFTKCNWLPVKFHYYQPIIKLDMLPQNYNHSENSLIGIDLNIDNQLDLLNKFHYNEELERIPHDKTNESGPYYNNLNFPYTDAGILYNMIRYFKPTKVVEIGSGESTKFTQLAIEQNKQETGNKTEHICIEPFEQLSFEKSSLTIIRERVENLDLSIFSSLSENDILFIDSSHVIRTGGDVVFEYLNIIPSLQKGVIVHCHDIFLPREYPIKGIDEWKLFWNEQYLLQALLSHSSRYKILLSLNFLIHHYKLNVEQCCAMTKRKKRVKEPSTGSKFLDKFFYEAREVDAVSFWFQVVE
jgi:hypothetical protein